MGDRNRIQDVQGNPFPQHDEGTRQLFHDRKRIRQLPFGNHGLQDEEQNTGKGTVQGFHLPGCNDASRRLHQDKRG